MESEHGVTFEWEDDFAGPCKAKLADELTFAMRSSYWTFRLAANLAMAALLGAAARQAVTKASICDFPRCGRELSPGLCEVHDNDE